MTITCSKSERISYIKTRIEELHINKCKVSNPIITLIYDKVIQEFEQEIRVVENSNDEYIVVEI